MEKGLKVAYLIHTLGYAGAEKHLLNLLPELRKNGVQGKLYIVTKHAHLPSLNDFIQQLEFRRINYVVYYRKNRFDLLVIAKRISTQLRSERYQILHTHLFNADLIGVLIKKIFYKQIVLISTKHGYRETDQYRYGLGHKNIRKGAYYHLTRYFNRAMDLNIAVSGALSDFLFECRLTHIRMPVVHHGMEIPHIENSRPASPTDFRIITVGRLVEIKGHIYLIRALEEVIKHVPSVSLLVLGDGPLHQELVREAARLGVSDKIEFLGFGDPFVYFPQCLLMVAPSIFEAFGFIYLEAFASKIPVIAFNSGAAPEIITDQESGFLVPVADSAALAKKVIDLLENERLRKTFAENGHNRLLNNFSIQQMATLTLNLYNRF